MSVDKIAILYQVQLPPIIDGIQKLMKPGGYSDSGADIAYALHSRLALVITPTEKRDTLEDKNWVCFLTPK